MPFSSYVLAEESSIPALKHVINSKSQCRKRFWLVALLLSVGLLIFHTVRLTQRYLDYEANSQYRSIFNDSFVLPTVFISFNESSARVWIELCDRPSEFPDSAYAPPIPCKYADHWTNRSNLVIFNASFATNDSYLTQKTLTQDKFNNHLMQRFRVPRQPDGNIDRIKGYMNFLWPQKSIWDPAFRTSGVEVKMNGITKVTISYSEESKLPYPYSTCVTDYPSIFERVKGMEFAQVPYNRKACYLMCAASISQYDYSDIRKKRFYPEIYGYRYNGSKMPADLNVSEYEYVHTGGRREN